MYIFWLSCVVTVVLLIIVNYYFKRGNVKKAPRTISGLWLTYRTRLQICALRIWLYQKSLPQRLDNYDPNSTSFDTSGLVPTSSEEELERPKLLVTDRHEDGVFIWGGDDKGRMIVAKVVRLSRRRACVYLCIRDELGRIYTLPSQPDSNFVNIDNEQCWRGGGLFLECVEPMRTWRMKFNGLLRCGHREKYDDNVEEQSEGFEEVIHAKIDCIWKAMKAPVDTWRDSSPYQLADALAREGTYRHSFMRALDRDGYDQLGALHGTVDLGAEGKKQWYLRGIRQHRWGMSDSATNLHRALSIYSYFSDGDALWIEGFSYKALISHCVMGYVLRADGSYHSVSATNLELTSIAEDEMPKNIFVQVTAGGKIYNVWHHLQKGISVCTGNPWTLVHEIASTYSATSNYEGWGLAVLTKRYQGQCPVPEIKSLPALVPPDSTTKSYVLSFFEEHCLNSSLVGGKGASLSFLTQMIQLDLDEEFLVPRGVVVTSTAWSKQLEESPELLVAIKSLEKAVTSALQNKIKEACVRIVKVMENVTVHPEIATTLQRSLEETFSPNFKEKRFAVRSSACGEDSAEASSAGQNETFLGCLWMNDGNGAKNVLQRILSCWASQFKYQSVEYRRQRGQPLNGGMAVVVQEVVPAEKAGVIFTRDPVTGNPASLTITCNYGLGESVVSASSEPDTYVVRRTWKNQLQIWEKTIGEKKVKTVLIDEGGTSDVEVPDCKRRKFCLEDDLVLKLSKIVMKVEDAFGSPRDIEFAVVGNVVFLLQSRPITSIDDWTDYELSHEADFAVPSDKDVFTIGNTGEVLPGYTTPLTLSTVVKAIDFGLQKQFIGRQWPYYRYDPSMYRAICSFGYCCMLNLGEICYKTTMEETISMINRIVDLSICGRPLTTKEIHKWAVKRYSCLSVFRKLYANFFSLYDLIFNSGRVKRGRALYSNYSIDTERATSAKALYKEISRRLVDLFRISDGHSHTSSASSMAQCIALVLLTGDNKEIRDDVLQDLAAVLCCIGETESGDVPTALKNLARAIAEDEELEEFLSMNPEEGKVWLESHPERVGKSYNTFVARHGHRCYKEFDLRTKSWGLAPENLVTSLQEMARHASSFEAKKTKTIDEAIKNIKTPITHSTKRALRFVLKVCGSAVRNREATKSLFIRTVDAFRRAYRALGHLMVSESRLPDADLVFYFYHREIGILLENRSARLIAKAVRRRRLESDLCKVTYPEVTIGLPKPICLENPYENARTDMSLNNHLTGTPVCLGTITGTARVALDLQEALNIKNGEILVTYSTDVGWTPYFPLLSGIITEIGGIISHGAVVAREYGLPCVVGVKGATKFITTGETIFLDGEKGTVTKVQKTTNTIPS